jgi:hypothetical protein
LGLAHIVALKMGRFITPTAAREVGGLAQWARRGWLWRGSPAGLVKQFNTFHVVVCDAFSTRMEWAIEFIRNRIESNLCSMNRSQLDTHFSTAGWTPGPFTPSQLNLLPC